MDDLFRFQDHWIREICGFKSHGVQLWLSDLRNQERHYPKGRTARSPCPQEIMRRIHWMQLFYKLSDPGMEDALCEIESVQQFAGLQLSERLPDGVAILNFRF